MKKCITILLLAVLLFNLAGYRCWFSLQEVSSSRSIEARLNDCSYNNNDLFTIKVPLSLPYSTNWSEFERYDGSIQVNGHNYNYVMRKIENDTLVLLCVANTEKNRLAAARDMFEKLVAAGNEPGTNKQNNSGVLLKLLTADCFNEHHFYFSSPLFEPLRHPIVNAPCILQRAQACPWQPPDEII